MGQSKSNRTGNKNRQRPAKSKLPVLLLSGGVLMLVFAAFAILGGNRPSGSSIPVEVEGRPAIKADQEKVDLGDVRLGEWVSASFELTNAGDKPLRFSKQPYIQVLEGCWPPVPTIGSMVLQPGESTTLSMEFMMHGDMGGPHDFRVHLPSNDPLQPDLTLAVLSNWVP